MGQVVLKLGNAARLEIHRTSIQSVDPFLILASFRFGKLGLQSIDRGIQPIDLHAPLPQVSFDRINLSVVRIEQQQHRVRQGRDQ